jgi:hypothetical protein
MILSEKTWDLTKLNSTSSQDASSLEPGWYKFKGASSDLIEQAGERWYIIRIQRDSEGNLYLKLVLGASPSNDSLAYYLSLASLVGKFYPIYFSEE